MRACVRVILVLAATSLVGCARQVSLGYVPTSAIATTALPRIGQVTATDQRGEPDPTWIGAVRGGFGNPLKELHTPRPLGDMVVEAFRDALGRRGLLAPSQATDAADMSVTIIQFDSTQYVRREANVDMVIELHEHAGGRLLYRDEVKSNPVEGSILALDIGIFGSPDDLQAVAQGAMNQAIDAALNKPAFVQALQTLAGPSS